MSDARILRDRQETSAAAIRRLSPVGCNGSEAMLARTKVRGTYPAVASAYYACGPLRIEGPETEGAAATFSEDVSRTIMALNVGSKVPPIGTRLIIHSSGGRWAFRYDG